jgi:hypothetical protein
MYLIVLSQVLSVFVITPRCFSQSDVVDGRGAVGRKNLAVFDIFCVLFYIFDVSVDFFVRGRRTNKRTLFRFLTSWTWLRLFASVLILLESIVSLTNRAQNFQNIRLIRTLYPVLLLSRDQNYKELLKGMFHSVRGSALVYVFLLVLLTMFTLVGYFIFHRFSTHAQHFETLFSAFGTVLHCFTSAPYALHVVEPYTAISQASQIFFVLLTYSTEVLCISLIVAAGQVMFYHYLRSYFLLNCTTGALSSLQ